MKKAGFIVLALVMAGVFAFVAYNSSASANGGRPFSTVLLGANEAPGPGDPDGSGTAHLTLNPGQGEVCFDISVTGIVLPGTGAHIHEAPVATPGPIRVHLTPPDSTGHSSGCVEDVSSERIMDIMKNPENYYVNVHNSEYPAGALRGQLSNHP